MNKCSYCGASFSGFGSKCQACTLRDSIKEENEKNRRQTESLQRESEANARREAHLQREQMDLLARQQRMIAAQQQEIAEQTVAIENEKLKELQKQTRLIEEQAVSTEEAFQAGYRVKNILSNFLVNENQDFFFDESYLTPKLNKSFSAGVDSLIAEKFSKKEVWLEPLMKRIRSIFNEQRDLFVQWSGNLNEKSYEGVFFEQVELIIGDVAINFGVLSTDLGTYVDEETGEVKFKNTEFGPVTDCRVVKELFVSCFEPDASLMIVNQSALRLLRIETIVKGAINRLSLSLNNQEKYNRLVMQNNIRISIFYLLVVFALYALLSEEVFSALLVGLLAIYISRGDLEIRSKHDLSRDQNLLRELRLRLVQTQDQLPKSGGSMSDIGVSVKDIAHSERVYSTEYIIIIFLVLALILGFTSGLFR